MKRTLIESFIIFQFILYISYVEGIHLRSDTSFTTSSVNYDTILSNSDIDNTTLIDTNNNTISVTDDTSLIDASNTISVTNNKATQSVTPSLQLHSSSRCSDRPSSPDCTKTAQSSPCTSHDFSCGWSSKNKAVIQPRNEIFIKHGVPTTAYCCINPKYNLFSSSVVLSAFSDDDNTMLSHTQIVDDYSVSVVITSDHFTEFILTCKDEDNMTMCSRKVAIGAEPLNVVDLSCITYNMEKLECSFKEPYNPVQLKDYILHCYSRYADNSTYKCNSSFGPYISSGEGCSNDQSESTTCWIWEGQSYSSSQNLLIEIHGSNTLGDSYFYYDVDQYVTMIPNPANITCIETDSRSVNISWKIPLDCFIPKLYSKVQYKLMDQIEWQQADVLFDSVSTTIQNLYPYQNYNFRVLIKSAESREPNVDEWWSDPSGEVTAKTLSALPEASPEVIPGCYDSSDVNFTTVHWKHLDPLLRNGPQFYYLVTVNNNQKFNTTANFINFTRDKQTHYYKVEIQSTNIKGVGEDISIVEVDTGVDHLLSPFFKSVVSHKSDVIVRWWMPDMPDDLILSYTLFWCIDLLDPQLCDGIINWKEVGSHTEVTLSPQDLNLDDDNQIKNTRFAVSVQVRSPTNGDVTSSSGMTWSECSSILHNIEVDPPDLIITDPKSNYQGLKWILSCDYWSWIMIDFTIIYCEGNHLYISQCQDVKKVNASVWNETTVIGPLQQDTSYTAWQIINYESVAPIISHPLNFTFNMKMNGNDGLKTSAIVWISAVVIAIFLLISGSGLYAQKRTKIFCRRLTQKPVVPLEKLIIASSNIKKFDDSHLTVQRGNSDMTYQTSVSTPTSISTEPDFTEDVDSSNELLEETTKPRKRLDNTQFDKLSNITDHTDPELDDNKTDYVLTNHVYNSGADANFKQPVTDNNYVPINHNVFSSCKTDTKDEITEIKENNDDYNGLVKYSHMNEIENIDQSTAPVGYVSSDDSLVICQNQENNSSTSDTQMINQSNSLSISSYVSAQQCMDEINKKLVSPQTEYWPRNVNDHQKIKLGVSTENDKKDKTTDTPALNYVTLGDVTHICYSSTDQLDPIKNVAYTQLECLHPDYISVEKCSDVMQNKSKDIDTLYSIDSFINGNFANQDISCLGPDTCPESFELMLYPEKINTIDTSKQPAAESSYVSHGFLLNSVVNPTHVLYSDINNSIQNKTITTTSSLSTNSSYVPLSVALENNFLPEPKCIETCSDPLPIYTLHNHKTNHKPCETQSYVSSSEIHNKLFAGRKNSLGISESDITCLNTNDDFKVEKSDFKSKYVAPQFCEDFIH